MRNDEFNLVQQFISMIFATFELIGWAECIAAELNGPACTPSMGLGTGGAALQGLGLSLEGAVNWKPGFAPRDGKKGSKGGMVDSVSSPELQESSS